MTFQFEFLNNKVTVSPGAFKVILEYPLKLEGVITTLPLHKEVIENKAFITGKYDIRWLENYLSKYDK